MASTVKIKSQTDKATAHESRDFLSPSDHSERMSRIRSKGTKCEREMARLLRHAGIRYRGHRHDLPGTPDFALLDAKVAVFVDGRFWHGGTLGEKGDRLNGKWLEKIRSNVRRDRRNARELRKRGWSVVRIWEEDVFTRPDWCLNTVRLVARKRPPA